MFSTIFLEYHYAQIALVRANLERKGYVLEMSVADRFASDDLNKTKYETSFRLVSWKSKNMSHFTMHVHLFVRDDHLLFGIYYKNYFDLEIDHWIAYDNSECLESFELLAEVILFNFHQRIRRY